MMVDTTGIGPGECDSSINNKRDAVSNESSNQNANTQSYQHIQSHNDPVLLKAKKSNYESNIGGNHPRTKSNQRWMKLRTTVQLSGAISSTIQKSKPTLKREDSFMKRFSTRQIQDSQRETMDNNDDYWSDSESDMTELARKRKKRRRKQFNTVVNPDENFYFYWLFLLTVCVLYNLWTLIVRQSFPELQNLAPFTWSFCDRFTDLVFVVDIVVQFRTGYLEQGLMVYNGVKLANHYIRSKAFSLDLLAMLPIDLLQYKLGVNPILRFPRFLKIYRVYDYYYMVESRTVYPNFWRVANLIHILLILAHWFGCFYYLLSEAENFRGDWVYPHRPGDYATLTRKYLGSLYWSTLTLTTIGDLPTPETNADKTTGRHSFPERRRYKKSRILQFNSNFGYVFTIVSYLIGVFIFATIVGQVGNVITNRNANRLEFERLLDGAKTYMRHHKVPSGMKRRVLRWYDYSWSRGRIQGGGDINTALGLLPDKLKTELALHVNLSVLKKVTIFQECQPEFLHDLVLKMKAYIFTPGDLICRKGEVAREMFIIADGILEVISETGHVLTTMKAGDFFGEIGILNLDGLNKRTADVRSVGYSELFSLSREDVLTAMKDYPEAQDILHTLGRKRLAEARNVTQAVNEQRRQAALTAADEDHRSKKKIVERIRSDMKGLKSALRKSYRETRTEDSVELNSLSGKSEQTAAVNVQHKPQQLHWSEDSIQEDGQQHVTNERKISAGFPLLNKLKSLTDKQHHYQQQQPAPVSREQPYYRGHSPPPPTSSETATQPQLFHSSCGNSEHPQQQQPQQEQQQQAPEEIEPIAPGLPLLQRLKILKQREAALEMSAQSTQKSQALQQQQSTNAHQSARNAKSLKKEVAFARDSQKPMVIDERPTKAQDGNSDILALWLLLKKATVSQLHNFSQKTPHHRYFKTSKHSNSSRKEDQARNGASGTAHQQQKRISSCADTINQLILQQNGNPDRNPIANVLLAENAAEYYAPTNRFITGESVPSRRDSTERSDAGDAGVKVVAASTAQPKLKLSLPLTEAAPIGKYANKTYASIADLSPEYSGLPFVKKLKILNERQKLAELEKNSLVRSSSLNSGGNAAAGIGSTANTAGRENSLTRSLSEATIAGLILRTQAATANDSRKNLPSHNESNQHGGPPTMNSPSCNDQDHNSSTPDGSSEETSERRNLKNILKSISAGDRALKDLLLMDGSGSASSTTDDDVELAELIKSFMTAQTIQGYLARHSTLEKSVRCYLNNLTSPPSSSNTIKSFNRFQYTVEDSMAASREYLTDEAKIRNGSYELSKCGCDTTHSPSRNPDLIPDVEKSMSDAANDLLATSSSTQPNRTTLANFADIQSCSFKDNNNDKDYHQLAHAQYSFNENQEQTTETITYCVQEMEMEVKKRDYLIEMLRSKVQELERHHEHCFVGKGTFQNTSYDQYNDVYFTRNDSTETVLSAPQFFRKSSVPSTEQAGPILVNRTPFDGDDNGITSSKYQQSLRSRNINIEIESDNSSVASETDELILDQSNNTLDVHRNQNWEVMMLAEELEKREQISSTRTPKDELTKVNSRTPLLNIGSLSEEFGTYIIEGASPSSSQRNYSNNSAGTVPLINNSMTASNDAAQQTSFISSQITTSDVNSLSSVQIVPTSMPPPTSTSSVSPDVVPSLL